MYDLIIVGAGPAGITASIYAARKKMNFLIITNYTGGQALWTSRVENYTGFPFISGPDLMKKFEDHLEECHVRVKEGETVIRTVKEGARIRVITDKNEYTGATLLIAAGKTSRKLNIPGEDRFAGKGISYCATCDAPFFSGKDVAVIGGGNSAFEAVLELATSAKSVVVIDKEARPRADAVMVDKAEADPKITIYQNARVQEVYGDDFVKGMKIRQGGDVKDIPVSGIFVEIGSVPATDFAAGVEKNLKGEIMISCDTRTSVPGIFAAGDITNVSAKQIIVACGEGAKAAIAAFEYISRKAEVSATKG